MEKKMRTKINYYKKLQFVFTSSSLKAAGELVGAEGFIDNARLVLDDDWPLD
jgi:hypothetical protein